MLKNKKKFFDLSEIFAKKEKVVTLNATRAHVL